MRSKALADAGEHAERQHVDLQQAERVDVVLVPFDEGAVVHRRVADGHDLDQRPARQHEAADVLRQVARKAHQLVRQLQHGWRAADRSGSRPACAHVLLGQLAAARRAPHHAGERGDCVLGQPHRLADVAHGRARAIGDDGGGERRRGRGRSGRRCTGSPPRAARARSRRRCRAARLRSGETKRSNSRSISVGSTAVMPRQ